MPAVRVLGTSSLQHLNVFSCELGDVRIPAIFTSTSPHLKFYLGSLRQIDRAILSFGVFLVRAPSRLKRRSTPYLESTMVVIRHRTLTKFHKGQHRQSKFKSTFIICRSRQRVRPLNFKARTRTSPGLHPLSRNLLESLCVCAG